MIEAEGMGNAVVADGSLFNASAFNPALLANNIDFTEIRILGLNVGNDPIGIANYLTGSDNLNNLQNSLQNVNQSFQDINNGLNASGGVNYQLFNQGVTGINYAVGNIQTAISKMTDKSIQLGVLPIRIAMKFDDHWGFQVYNNTQMAVHISQGSLSQSILQLAAFPQMQGSSPAQVQAAAVSFYNSSKSLVNAFLSPTQQQNLSNAITSFQAISNPNSTDVANFATTINNVMTSVSPNQSDQTLFNDIAPITSIFFTDTVAMATYCTRPLEDDPAFSAGMNFKLVNRRITSINSNFLVNQNTNGSSDVGNDIKDDFQQTVLRWGVDLGVLYEFDDPKLAVGLAATDILHSTGTLNTNPGDPLSQNGGPVVIDPAPAMVTAGLSFKPNRDLTLNADIEDMFSGSSDYQGLSFLYHLNFGFNYNLLGIFQLRGGVTNGNLCGGLGLPMGIQYAFAVDNLTQSYNHYLQLINFAF